MQTRTAVVLLNLGGPDSLDAVEPFLYNLFSDPDIFRLPLGFLTQKPFAWLISRRRTPEARHNYAAIGGSSPLLANTEKQAAALRAALAAHNHYDVFIAMRYWHPLTRAVVADLKANGYENVLLLPLYPQYSGTTTGSSVNEFNRECARQHYNPAVTVVREWYTQPDYLAAIVESIRAEAAKFPANDPAKIDLLFSAHGLPKKFVERGDPYETQIRATFDLLRAKLGWPHVTLCYQSRVGPLEWLRPYIEDTIRAKAATGCTQMLVYPIAFVSDHSETLYELGIQYAQLAKETGIAHYRVVPALNADPLLIRALTDLVLHPR
ncbi:MAG: ferrochelatase [Gammaproteobacteria bacterium]|nr:ferrochelatase [Gammaproteobacteria bacterium]